MTPAQSIPILRNLSTWGRLSADQRGAILAGLVALEMVAKAQKELDDARPEGA